LNNLTVVQDGEEGIALLRRQGLYANAARSGGGSPTAVRSTSPGSPARRWEAAALAFGVLCLSTGGCARFSRSAPNGPLTTVEQVRRLTPEAVAAQVPVHLRGTVTYVDGAVRLVLMQDATGAVRVEQTPAGLEHGTSVDLEGTVLSGGANPEVTCGSVRFSGGHSPLPAPARPSAQDLASGRLQYAYVEIEGVVRSSVIERSGRCSLVMHALGRDIKVAVRDQSAFNYRSLVDAVVRARGDIGTSFDASGIPIGVKLWVTAIEDVEVVKPARAAADVPVGTVASLLSMGRAVPSDNRIHLHGSVSLDAGRLTLRDATGAVPLQPAPSESIEVGRGLDVLCFVDQAHGEPALSACVVPDWAREQPSPAPLAVLTTIRQVRELSEDQARRAYPVHLQAVVTYHNPLAVNTFIQDRTGGIYVFFVGAQPELHLGDLAEFEGFTRPGQFAPVVAASSVHAIGRQALPKPFPADMEQLFSGIADSAWVEADGVVHSIRWEGGHPTLGVDWGIQHFSAYVYGSAKLPDSLLDSHIHIQGVCGARFNFKRQILGVQLFVPDASFIRVEGGAPHVPPLLNIDQLLQFSPASHFGERDRIRGVVILTNPTGPTYVSDPTGGVLIQNHAAAALAVGDSVEVTGLPAAVPGRFNTVFHEADIRKLGHPGPPAPLLVTATDIVDEGYDAQLVQLDAVLVSQGAAKGGQALVLQAGDRVFEARIDRQPLPALEQGSLLRVTGVTAIETYESEQTVLPRTFSILLRSRHDVVVLRSASWWTAARTFQLLGLVCAVALLAFAWIMVLRRRVRQQTAEVRGSRQMLQLVLDHIPQRVFWKDREGRYLGCNKPFADDAGAPTPQDLVGKTAYDVSHWRAMADLYTADDRQVLETGHAKTGYEEPLFDVGGTQRWVRSSKIPLPGSIGGVLGVLGTYEDITERKRAKEELRAKEYLLSESQSIAHVGSWEWTVQGGAIAMSWTPEMYRLFGVSLDTFVLSPETFVNSLHPDDRAAMQAWMSACLGGLEPPDLEFRVCLPDGSVRYLNGRGHLVQQGAENSRMVGVAQDITERKRAQEALLLRTEELKRSNTELEQFAYVASHDLQEPLRMVSSYVQLLARRYQGKLDADADEFIAFAVDGAKRMQHLINDLLAFSRVTTKGHEFKPVEAEAALKQALANLKAAIEESQANVISDPLPVVKADSGQLTQLFQNLVGNAIKFRSKEPPGVRVSVERRATEWEFSVQDDGIGIEPQHLERIFVIFQRLHTVADYPGTGIGLAICKKIAERHGGRLWVTSEPGVGSAFHFTIPVQGL
jgi:PAS domain S-box-containing protein